MTIVDRLYAILRDSASIEEAVERITAVTPSMNQTEVVGALAYLAAVEHRKAHYAAAKGQTRQREG